MKSGISLVDMAKEIQRQADLKADYMLDTRSLRAAFVWSLLTRSCTSTPMTNPVSRRLNRWRSIPLPTGRLAHT